MEFVFISHYFMAMFSVYSTLRSIAILLPVNKDTTTNNGNNGNNSSYHHHRCNYNSCYGTITYFITRGSLRWQIYMGIEISTLPQLLNNHCTKM